MIHIQTPKVLRDGRGLFFEAWRKSDIDLDFVQSNYSSSRPFTLRGLHYQLKNPQSKLMRVVHGSAVVVAVDLRKETRGKWRMELLDDINHHGVLIPPNFAVGFLALERGAVMTYLVTAYHAPGDDYAIDALDPEVGVKWPQVDYVRSGRDREARRLGDVPLSELP